MVIKNITACFDNIDNEFGVDTESTTPSSSIIPVDEVIEVPAYECSNARDNFETAYANDHYQISYDEVAPLVTTALVNHMISPVIDGDMSSVAEALLNIFGGKPAEFKPEAHWSEKKVAKRRAIHDKREATRSEFVTKWQDRLGYIGGWCEVSSSFVYEANAKTADNPLFANVQFAAAYPLGENTPKRFGSKKNRKVLAASKGLPMVSNLGELVLAIMVRVCKNMTSKEKVELIVDLDSLKRNPTLVLTDDGKGVIIEDFTFDLGKASITRKEGRTQTAIKAVMYNEHFIVDGVDCIFVWILNAMRMSAKGLAQAINMSSNCFKQQVNYGAKPDPTSIAWHVYENMLKEANISAANSTYFPYSNICNRKLAVTTLALVLSKGVMAICDKQNKSWITINSGVESLFVGRDKEGYIINLNDMGKPTKMFNRPAANVFLHAEII